MGTILIYIPWEVNGENGGVGAFVPPRSYDFTLLIYINYSLSQPVSPVLS